LNPNKSPPSPRESIDEEGEPVLEDIQEKQQQITAIASPPARTERRKSIMKSLKSIFN
jgi:hypothetical protein